MAVAGALASYTAFASGLPGQGGLHYGRSLSFFNTHTHEALKVTYWRDGRYDPAAMAELGELLRDHRTGNSREMSAELMNVLYGIRKELERRHPGQEIVFHIISGYRSPKTNAMLRAAGGGQAKDSRHMHGDAIDIRVPGIETAEIRDVAWCLQRGGVGFYPGSDFVHVDTYKVRHWNWSPRAGMCNRTNS